jgi:hypothetical protein
LADTTFTSGTVIASAWLNDLNDLFYTTLGGATTAAGVRSAVSAAKSGANSDITSVTGLTTPLSVGQGGTGLTAPGASGNVLASNGTAWVSSAVPTTSFSTVAVSGQANVVADSVADTLTIAAGTGITITTDSTTDTVTISAPNAGAYVLLGSISPSAVSEQAIDGYFSSTYDEYEISCVELTVSANSNILATLSLGGSYQTGANYRYHKLRGDSGASTYNGSGVVGATSINTISNLSASAGHAHSLRFRVRKPSTDTSNYKIISWEGDTILNGGNIEVVRGSGYYAGATGALSAIKLAPSTGTFSGTIRIYGIKNS